MTSEKVLLIGLKTDEKLCIEKLLKSFEIDIDSRDVFNTNKAETFLLDPNICLVVLRINPKKRPDQEIRIIKRYLLYSIPLLILIPPENVSKARNYIKIGADDFWVLPIDETTFSPRFFVLLDWGRGVLSMGVKKRTNKSKKSQDKSIWNRIMDGFQGGLSFFASKKLIRKEQHDSVAKWEKVKRLGFGSFGEVWLVTDNRRNAVAKIPHTKKINISYLREAAIMKRMAGHPNAIQLIDVVKEDGLVILIQEYVEGTTLHKFIEKGITSMQKEKAFLQLVNVTAYAHQQKVMHRDIKPENIIINSSDNLKLLDFGTAKALSDLSISHTVVGSRPYMAPEQIMGKSRIVSDVWALGVLLYFLATKCLPFYNDNEKILMDTILEINPTSPCKIEPDVPKKLEHIILKCLEKEYENRYPNALELQKALFKCIPDFGKGEVL